MRFRNELSSLAEVSLYFLGGKGGQYIGLKMLPPSCADCLEIWEPQHLEPSGPVQACKGIALLCVTTFICRLTFCSALAYIYCQCSTTVASVSMTCTEREAFSPWWCFYSVNTCAWYRKTIKFFKKKSDQIKFCFCVFRTSVYKF